MLLTDHLVTSVWDPPPEPVPYPPPGGDAAGDEAAGQGGSVLIELQGRASSPVDPELPASSSDDEDADAKVCPVTASRGARSTIPAF